jgi:hypothetical protein
MQDADHAPGRSALPLHLAATALAHSRRGSRFSNGPFCRGASQRISTPAPRPDKHAALSVFPKSGWRAVKLSSVCVRPGMNAFTRDATRRDTFRKATRQAQKARLDCPAMNHLGRLQPAHDVRIEQHAPHPLSTMRLAKCRARRTGASK